MIIDIHTHIFNEKTYQEYSAKVKGNALKVFVLHRYEFNLDKFMKFIDTKENLFVVGSIDINKDVAKQLSIHHRLFEKKKIFGVKLYPGYQYFYPSDKNFFSIAKLCEKFNKPLIFHSGDVYDPKNKALLKYSHPIHIDELAVRFPKCKIIISHFGFPYFLETANIVSKNKNVYTDISGTIDETKTRKESRNRIKYYAKDLERVFGYFPNIKSKVMSGTDFIGNDTPLNLVEPYMKVAEEVFSKKEQESVFYKLAEELFFKVAA
ncbi:MAG: amidohydrolase family protein [bacterium]